MCQSLQRHRLGPLCHCCQPPWFKCALRPSCVQSLATCLTATVHLPAVTQDFGTLFSGDLQQEATSVTLSGRGCDAAHGPQPPLLRPYFPAFTKLHDLILGFLLLVCRGNVIDLAVAIVVGTSFTALVK